MKRKLLLLTMALFFGEGVILLLKALWPDNPGGFEGLLYPAIKGAVGCIIGFVCYIYVWKDISKTNGNTDTDSFQVNTGCVLLVVAEWCARQALTMESTITHSMIVGAISALLLIASLYSVRRGADGQG